MPRISYMALYSTGDTSIPELDTSGSYGLVVFMVRGGYGRMAGLMRHYWVHINHRIFQILTSVTMQTARNTKLPSYTTEFRRSILVYGTSRSFPDYGSPIAGVLREHHFRTVNIVDPSFDRDWIKANSSPVFWWWDCVTQRQRSTGSEPFTPQDQDLAKLGQLIRKAVSTWRSHRAKLPRRSRT